jgi:hypothetical protein
MIFTCVESEIETGGKTISFVFTYLFYFNSPVFGTFKGAEGHVLLVQSARSDGGGTGSRCRRFQSENKNHTGPNVF